MSSEDADSLLALGRGVVLKLSGRMWGHLGEWLGYSWFQLINMPFKMSLAQPRRKVVVVNAVS